MRSPYTVHCTEGYVLHGESVRVHWFQFPAKFSASFLKTQYRIKQQIILIVWLNRNVHIFRKIKFTFFLIFNTCLHILFLLLPGNYLILSAWYKTNAEISASGTCHERCAGGCCLFTFTPVASWPVPHPPTPCLQGVVHLSYLPCLCALVLT